MSNSYPALISLDDEAKIIRSEDVMIFAPEYNTKGRKDATGAFHVGVERFMRYYELDEACLNLIDNSNPPKWQAQQLLSRMAQSRPCPPQIYVYFCHGFDWGIQFGLRSPTPNKPITAQNKKDFADYLGLVSRHKAPINIYYACSTGDDPDDDPLTAPGFGDFSFGDTVRDELCRLGCTYNRVVSHYSAGHAFYNPDVIFFDGFGSPFGGHGGQLVARTSTRESRAFGRLLKMKPGDEIAGVPAGFVWRFPFMTIADIHNQVVKALV